MNPAVTQSAAAPPDDPVARTLDDPAVQEDLLNHALAILGRRLVDRPAADRIDKAKEAFQEMYARALQKRPDYDPGRPVRPWLHGIMAHVLSETTRSLRRSPAQESVDTGEWEKLATDLAPDAADVVPNQLDVLSFLAKLSPEHQEILRFRFYDDLSHNEIAVRLGISCGNARVRLCRALNALKKIAWASQKEDRP